jgi:hypothetical protein
LHTTHVAFDLLLRVELLCGGVDSLVGPHEGTGARTRWQLHVLQVAALRTMLGVQLFTTFTETDGSTGHGIFLKSFLKSTYPSNDPPVELFPLRCWQNTLQRRTPGRITATRQFLLGFPGECALAAGALQ